VIIEELLLGHDVALVSDAGTPCISDPGSTLIAHVHGAGVTVVPIPGPSALTAALSMSGMLYKNFLFVGFLPNSKADRRRRLGSLKDNASVMVFYESPRRVLSCLGDISQVLGNRHAFVVRELSKIHEEYFRGELDEVISCLKQKPSIKGEFVLIIEGCLVTETPDGDDIDELIEWYRDEGQNTLSYSVKKISKDLGISKAKVYQRALQIWEAKS
jgi:16S rRNA (cytidine1402-2'-O)-methyltransferase